MFDNGKWMFSKERWPVGGLAFGRNIFRTDDRSTDSKSAGLNCHEHAGRGKGVNAGLAFGMGPRKR